MAWLNGPFDTPERPLKGALLALASAASVSVTFIASKQAMQELSPLAFTPLWFGLASLWGIGFYVWQYGPSWPASLKGTAIRSVLFMGGLNGLANYLFFSSINLGDPTLTAFFSRSETLYTVLLGAWWLGERMRRWQWLGVAVAIAGTGLITFKAGPVVWLMLWLTLVSNFFLALSTLVAKKDLLTVPALILSTARTMVMCLILALIGLAAGQLTWPGLTTWLWLIGGAFFGPFLSYVLFYQSMLYLNVSKGSVIRSTQPLFVAVYSLILFGAVISSHQLLGGLLMVAGVILMLWEKK